MAVVAPVRFLGPIRTSHTLSTSSITTSKTSLLFLLHCKDYPSLHEHCSNVRMRRICASGEPPTQRRWQSVRGGRGSGSFRGRESFRGRGNYRDRGPPVGMTRLKEKEDGDGGEENEREGVNVEDNSWRGDRDQGGRQKSAMARIVEKLRAIGNEKGGAQLDFNKNRPATEVSVFLPRPGQPAQPWLDRKWSGADHPVPRRAPDDPWQLSQIARFPWDKDAAELEEEEEEEPEKKKKVKPPSMAELTIPEPELKRLRALGLQVQGRLKIGRLGVTPGIVEAIHDRWRTCEIAKVKCDAPLSMNMKKAHEDLEKLTGGLVIWRSGSAAVVYRRKEYVHPFVREREEREERERRRLMSPALDENDEKKQLEAVDVGSKEEEEQVKEGEDVDSKEEPLVGKSGTEEENIQKEKEDAELIMMEEILDGLGPRYSDWTGRRPVPVDGDLLLSPDFEFKRPFRLLPYGVKAKLTNFEMTEMRHLARPIPPHFVLGRNRGLSGLAAAIVKLWENSEIVKIGVKRGVQNTSNERMAEELKRLTGGTLLSRDKEFIVFYRGKDFLPPAVQSALEERDRMAKALQEEEEKLRMAGRKRPVQLVEPSKVGTLGEALETRASWEAWQTSDEARRQRVAARKAKRAQATDRIRSKMRLALQKKERAQIELAKIDAKMKPAHASLDKEHLSDGERYMYKKLGLKMKAFLLLGRRGVFGGTVENMHLHWKYRELVKILVKAPLNEAQQTAKMLEIESGGVLVDIVTTSKGQAIIVYRGKNYQRPPELRPRHLLTKRQALKRSLEMQRMQSLEKHIHNLEKEIEAMQAGLDKMVEEDEELEHGSHTDAGTRDDLEDAHFNSDEDPFEDDPFYKGELKRMGAKADPFFRAEPLTRKERNHLRQQIPLMLGKTANFNIGKTTIYEDLAKSICAYFQKHPFVKIGVKGRAKSTSVVSIVEQIEDSTGAVLISTEPSKLVFYRGWPAGEERPDLKEGNEESADVEAALRTNEYFQEAADASYLAEQEQALNSPIHREKRGADVESEDESESLEDDDFGIDAWNEEDWDTDEGEEEEEEEEEEEVGLDDIEGQWLGNSNGEFDETDADIDELENGSVRDMEDVGIEQGITLKSGKGE